MSRDQPESKLKLPNTRCTTQWGRGVITDVHSPNNLSVDEMPRHILDLRCVVHVDDDVIAGAEGNEDEPVAMQRPQRERAVPIRARDYLL